MEVYILSNRVSIDDESETGFAPECPQWMVEQFSERLNQMAANWTAMQQMDGPERRTAYKAVDVEKDILIRDMHAAYQKSLR